MKTFLANDNQLENLKVKHLTKLEDLRCNKNQLEILDVFGLRNLKILDASHNILLNEPILGDNPNLIQLDLAENNIDNLDFPPLPNLRILSLRENSTSFDLMMGEKKPTKTVILRSPTKLIFLDFIGYSNIKGFEIHKDYPLENTNGLILC